MLGAFLCWLGVHDNVVAWRNEGGTEYGGWRSVGGGCVRCNKPFQWDN